MSTFTVCSVYDIIAYNSRAFVQLVYLESDGRGRQWSEWIGDLNWKGGKTILRCGIDQATSKCNVFILIRTFWGALWNVSQNYPPGEEKRGAFSHHLPLDHSPLIGGGPTSIVSPVLPDCAGVSPQGTPGRQPEGGMAGAGVRRC